MGIGRAYRVAERRRQGGSGRGFARSRAGGGEELRYVLFPLAPVLRQPIGFGERSFQRRGVEIAAIRRRAGLLSPRLVEGPSVDRVEAELVEQDGG